MILVDDTSRISRSLADTVRLREDLNFTGIRFVAVSQGIDSDDEQADVMMTVHGLVDSLYIKELAKKTHRGLEGLALKGFHTGGSCFGYRSEKLDGGSQLQIDEQEAAVVRRIFQLSASGLSLKVIAKELNAEGIPPPRGTKKKTESSWVYTAIREMLRRDIYCGRVVWNKRKYKKRPGTNKTRESVGCHRETGTEDCAARTVGSCSGKPQGDGWQVSRYEAWTSEPIHQCPLPLQRNSQMRRMWGEPLYPDQPGQK